MLKRNKVKVRKTTLDRVKEQGTAKPEWFGPKRPGGGSAARIGDLKEWQGTSRHVCGFWPNINGSASSIHGAQIGRHHYDGKPVGFDPLAWFDRGYIGNPSVFVLSQPGFGKSTLLRKMMTGTIAAGTNVLVLGDRKNEHSGLIRLIGGRDETDPGQVIHLGPGRGKINVLDPGGVIEAVARIRDECEDPDLAEELCSALIEDMHERRLAMVKGLIGIYRQAPVIRNESSILDEALRHLHRNHKGVPVLADLLATIRAKPIDVRRVANDWGDDNEYRAIVRPLENDLVGLTSGGGFGQMFNGETTEEVRRDKSVCFDIHGISESDKDAIAAAYIACWSAGFGMIDVSHALSDAGLEPAQRFFVVMDEFWQPLKASPGMVDRVDGITRLNRDKGVGIAYASHTLADLEAMESESDRTKAREFVARSSAVILGALNRRELEERVGKVVPLKPQEIDLLVGWNVSAPLSDDQDNEVMPGIGKFLIKVSKDPGLPVDVVMSAAEIEHNVHDTNKRIRKQERTTA